ncbi:MAG: hypothetical protein CMH98_13965 [Oceanospirillaceae bacterium]|nr:hypothetical protein [Oceanospirillaceae bacterium]
MSNILVNNKTGETRWPASFNSLLMFSGASLQKTMDRPITAGDFTLHQPAPAEKPAGDVVKEIHPVLIDGTWTQQWESRSHTAEELNNLKAQAKLEIDRQAEAQRMKYMSKGEGKAAVYLEKIKEADRYRADAIAEAAAYPAGADQVVLDNKTLESIVSERYPLLASTIGIDGNTLDDVVVVIEAMRAQWKTIAADIERKGKLAQKAIDDATTGAEIEDAKHVTW